MSHIHVNHVRARFFVLVGHHLAGGVIRRIYKCFHFKVLSSIQRSILRVLLLCNYPAAPLQAIQSMDTLEDLSEEHAEADFDQTSLDYAISEL